MFESWALSPLVLFVLATRFADLLAFRDFRHCDFPPPAAVDRRAIGIGFDRDDVGPISGARARERCLQLANGLHVLRNGTERSCMGGEVDGRCAEASLLRARKEI